MRTNENSGWSWMQIQKKFLASHQLCANPRDSYWCLHTATDVHHIVARIDGGGDNEENLMALCGPCHDIETQELKARLAKERKRRDDEQRRYQHHGLKRTGKWDGKRGG